MDVETEVIARNDLPLQVGQPDVEGCHGCHVEVAAGGAILRRVEVVLVGLLAHAAPAGTHGQHAEHGLEALHPGFVAQDPLQRDRGEVAPAVARAELGGAVGTHGEVGHVAALIGVVGGEGVVHRAPLAVAGGDVVDQSAGGRVGDGVRRRGQAVAAGVLVVRRSGGELEAAHEHHRVVLVLEGRDEGQGLLGIERDALRRAGVRGVHLALPAAGRHFLWIELVVILVEDVHVDRAAPVELPVVLVETEQLVVEHQLGRHVVGAALVLGQLGRCHGVDVGALVFLEDVGALVDALPRHGVERRGVLARQGVFLIDADVGHLLQGDAQQVVVVHVVLRIGHGEVGADTDTL